MNAKNMTKAALAAVAVIGLNAQAEELYYSASGPGYYPWDNVAGWIIYNSGATPYGQLPTTNDNVRINATAPKAENGNALTVTNGVFAECNLFAAGDQNYPGTAWFRLDGGSLTCASHFITGRYYPGLATLESGTLFCMSGGNFYIGSQSGGYGTVTNNGATVEADQIVLALQTAASPSVLVHNGGSVTGRTEMTLGYRGDARMVFNGGTMFAGGTCYVGRVAGSYGALELNDGNIEVGPLAVIGHAGAGLATLNGGTLSAEMDLNIGHEDGGDGTVTNNGALLQATRLRVGYARNTRGKLVHNAGTLDCRSTSNQSSLQIGFNGGVGEFEANSGFSAYAMAIGNRTGLSDPPGTGTVTVTEGAIGVVNNLLRVRNGALLMRGGTIRLQNTSGTATNLFVRQDDDGQALIRGWGSFTNTNENITLRMLHNGQVIADGEGVERDLDFNLIAVVNNDIPNGANGTNGWYAVNKGRLILPRVFTYATSAGTYSVLWGDLYSDAIPDIVNSVGLTLVTSTSATRYVRGGLCATDRSDIPVGLPKRMRPIGIWCVGCYSDKVAMTKSTFSNVALTFRYDHAQLQATDSSLRLFRYDGTAWVQVGSCLPGGDPLISTDGALAPVATGDYNIGWFAVMAVERKGTMISVH